MYINNVDSMSIVVKWYQKLSFLTRTPWDRKLPCEEKITILKVNKIVPTLCLEQGKDNVADPCKDIGQYIVIL